MLIDNIGGDGVLPHPHGERDEFVCPTQGTVESGDEGWIGVFDGWRLRNAQYFENGKKREEICGFILYRSSRYQDENWARHIGGTEISNWSFCGTRRIAEGCPIR
jgi:hypothetical protein